MASEYSEARHALTTGSDIYEVVGRVTELTLPAQGCLIADQGGAFRVYLRGGQSTWPGSNALWIETLSLIVGSHPAHKWVLALLTDLVASLPVGYAQAYLFEEYQAKRLSSGPSTPEWQLPEVLYWANYFGPVYSLQQLVGSIRDCQGVHCREVGGGQLIVVGDDPSDWQSPEYQSAEQCIRNCLTQG